MLAILQNLDECLPFFIILMKGFERTNKCQMAFELVSPPLLSPSKPDEELFLYLAISSTAVSSALI